jgi:vacuolar-type H+-ATPase subunit H
MTDTDDNIVESDVTGFGNPSLDSDKINDSTDSAIDNLLDAAINGQQEENNEQPNITDSGDDAENLLQDSSVSTETPSEKTTGESPVDVQPEPQQPIQPQIDIDPEIAAIEQPRNLSEKNQSNWRKLQETASTYKKQAEEAEQLRQKLQELEQGPAQIPQDYEELKKFRQTFDIKNDPEFRSKYAQPIESAKNNIYGILRKHGAAEEVIASIEKEGGPDKINDEFWRNPAFQNLPLTDVEKLKRNLVDVSDLREKQDQEIQYAAENAEQILAEREQEKGQWYEKTIQEIDHNLDEITKDLPWARFAEAPANATPEQLQQVQSHNARVADLATKFESALWPTTAQERTNVAAAAVFSHVVSEQLRTEQTQKNALLEQVKKLTAENNSLKSSSKMPKQSTANQSVNKPSSMNDRIKMNAADAIDLGLDEALGA